MLYKYLTNNGELIGTLLQNDKGLGEVYAALMAAYSRSDKGILQLIEQKKEEGNREVIKRIVDGYGHSSVRGLSHHSIFMEDVTRLDAAEFFYNHPLQDGQERSTRYQSNFSCISLARYQHILDNWIKAYKELYLPTYKALGKYFSVDINNSKEANSLKVRTLDCTRYLLPLGLKTSFAAIQSSREWSRYIAYLKAYKRTSNRGETLEKLLTDPDFSPEARICIRHTNNYKNDIHLETLLNDIYTSLITSRDSINSSISIKEIGVLDNLSRLINPIGTLTSFNNKEEVYGKVLSYINLYDHHNEASNELVVSKGMYTGYLDIGSLIDINRHRSIAKFIPLLHRSFNIFNELNRSNSSLFSLCPYLDLVPDVKTRYEEVFDKQYSLIKEDTSEDTKLLLPNGHLTYYAFNIGLKELIYITKLRSGPEGHIAYRLWTKELAKDLLDIEINLDSKEDFLNR